MNEFTQTALGCYLGVWRYKVNATRSKYYSVIPTGNNFEIRWGGTLDEMKSRKDQIVIGDSEEVYRRILSKARGGFEIINQIAEVDWTPKCHDTYDTISEVLATEKIEARKRKPRKRTLSLVEWMSGMEEYRENDQP